MKTQYDIERILQEMRDEYWRGIEEEEDRKEIERAEILVFLLGEERFGLPTPVTRGILRLPRLVRVPRVPEHIRGVINLRGEIVAVSDLRPLFGLPWREPGAGSRLIVVEAAGLMTALIVDAVEGIRHIPVSAIELLTEGLADFPREAVTGQIFQEGGLVLLLDMEHILCRPEFVIDQQSD